MALDPRKFARRAFTAVVGAVVLGAIVLFLPKWCFHIVLVALGLYGCHEFGQLAEGLGYRLYKLPAGFAIIYGVITLYVPFLQLSWLPYLTVLLAGMVSIVPPRPVEKMLPQLGITLMAAAYFSLAMVSLAYIHQMEQVAILLESGHKISSWFGTDAGRHLIVLFILVVWLGDSFAYIGGSILGRHKIAPVLSPKKTYEGAVANLLGNFTALAIGKAIFLPQLTLYDMLILTLVFGFLGFFGDIIESSWKRGSKVKDSSQLFPGHGGILDRIDSIFLTAPVFYVYVNISVFGRQLF